MQIAKKMEVDPSIAIFDLLDDDLKYPRDSIEVGMCGDAIWQPLIAILDVASKHPIAFIRADASSNGSVLREEARKFKKFCKRSGLKVPMFLFVVTANQTRIHCLGSSFKWKAISTSTFPTYASLVNLADENRRATLASISFFKSAAFIAVLKWVSVVSASVIAGGLLVWFGWK